ncbi:hypothetical protein PVAP13_2NG155506 [Panicum virgatum]|uniref:DUF7769 domain-containing protein n=2 Tax=Panicum virgatum TaxID=38727 RepID=A0A8T0VI35_PANVG|nr:hypothetical protein PVAP13_2NG155506 [Panicum virgatum]
MADLHPVHGIDLNVPASENEPEEDAQELRQEDQVHISNPIDWDQVQEDFFDLDNPIFFHQTEEDQDQGAAQDAQAQDTGEDAPAQGAGEDEQAPDASGDGHHNGQGSVLPDLNAMPDVEDGTENIFEDFGSNIGQGSSSGTNISKRKQYSDDTKRAVYAMLLEGSVRGHLPEGLSLHVSLAMDVSLRCVQRIWKEGQKRGGIHAVINKRVGHCGRKRIELPMEAITAIPFQDRTTLEDLARRLGVSKSHVHRRLKEGKIERHSSAIKPFLTDENKKARVQHALNMLEPGTVPHQPVFKLMYNVIHADEKWYYRTKANQKYYCTPGEERPRRTCKSKSYIEKVMFFGGQSRPWLNDQNVCVFDGKIGIYAFVTTEPAKRKSPNRPRGTPITKPITSVTRDVIRRYLIDKMLPDIKAKWPAEGRHETIWIQQDNCRSHIPVDDPEFCAAAQADGWDIRLTCQPANSPDTNVLDLGLFAAIQALFQRSGMPKTIDEIVQKVEAAYWNFPVGRSNRVFLTLQGCLREILKEKGGQHYPVPHMKKATLERLGILPKTLSCDPTIVQEAIEFLASV